MQPTTPTTTDPPSGNVSVPQAGHAGHIEGCDGVAYALAALARLLGSQAAQEVTPTRPPSQSSRLSIPTRPSRSASVSPRSPSAATSSGGTSCLQDRRADSRVRSDAVCSHRGASPKSVSQPTPGFARSGESAPRTFFQQVGLTAGLGDILDSKSFFTKEQRDALVSATPRLHKPAPAGTASPHSRGMGHDRFEGPLVEADTIANSVGAKEIRKTRRAVGRACSGSWGPGTHLPLSLRSDDVAGQGQEPDP